MTELEFWKIISNARHSFFKKTPTPNEHGMIEGVMDHQAKSLRKFLATLPPEDIAVLTEYFAGSWMPPTIGIYGLRLTSWNKVALMMDLQTSGLG